MAKSSDIYAKEFQNLESAKKFLKKEKYDKSEIQLEFKMLVENYEDIFDQVKIITKISDRLQRKLDKTNDKLNESNDQLNEKNIQLEETIDALEKAKVGRKATTYVLVFAVLLFIISEAVVEPRIEIWAAAKFSAKWAFWIGLFLKLIIAFLIKPGEMMIERRLLKSARREAKKQAQAHA